MTPKQHEANPVPSALLSSIDKVRELMNKEAAGNATAYEIGREVQAIRTAPDKYGKGAVEAMAAALGCTGSLLYSRATVAAAWNEKEFAALSAKKTTNGVALTFSHFVVVAKAPKHDRAELLQRSLDEGLTVRALARLIPPSTKERAKESENDVGAVLRRLRSSAEVAFKAFSEEKELLTRLLSESPVNLDASLILHTTAPLRKLSVVAGQTAQLLDARQSSAGPSTAGSPQVVPPPARAVG